MTVEIQAKGSYLVLLPDQVAPQPLNIGTGWTGWGFKGQIAEKIEQLKGMDARRIRLSVEGSEISDGAFVSSVIADGQVVKVEVTEAESEATHQVSGKPNSEKNLPRKGFLARIFSKR